MALLIDNPQLEDRLRRLGRKQQPKPLSATRMAELILYEHTRDIRRRDGWRRKPEGADGGATAA